MVASDKSVSVRKPPARRSKSVAEPASNRSVLFHSDSSAVEHVCGSQPGQHLAITFAPPAWGHLVGYGYLEQPLIEAGFDLLAIKQAANIGYADLNADMLRDIVQQLPPYESCVIIGSEDAGAAAIRLFSAMAGATIVALSPVLPNDFKVAPHPQADIVIVSDPTWQSEVENHLAARAHVPSARFVRLAHAGLPVSKALTETGTIIELARSLSGRRPFSIQQHFRQHRGQSATALLALGDATFKARHFRAAQNLLKRSYDVEPSHPAAIAYCHALAQDGDPAAAASFMGSVVQREPQNPHLLAVQAYFEDLAGWSEQALASIRQAVTILPEMQAFQLAERRMLIPLYEELKLKQRMTAAALDKARAELELRHGGGEKEFSWPRFYALLGATIGILLLVAAAASIFRLV